MFGGFLLSPDHERESRVFFKRERSYLVIKRLAI
jgi:hypothetical protein